MCKILRLAATVAVASGAEWWKETTAAFRTVSLACNGMDLQDAKTLVDGLHASGVSAFSMNAAYDAGSGYDQSQLWCGLAASDLKTANPLIGTNDDLKGFVAYVHSKNMKIVSWMNPSYFWTGSQHVKTAESDVKQYGIDALPAQSPARWFKWRESKYERITKPADDAPSTVATWDWVHDEDANAAYFSTWGNQPCTDWTSPEWQAYFKGVMEFWINDIGIDGFIFDYPDGYISTGYDSKGVWSYTPSLMKTHITDVVKSVGQGQVAAFAELYEAPNRAYDYGFDGALSDDASDTRATVINQAIISADASSLESSFIGEGGPDSYAVLCYYSVPERCAVAWTRRVAPTSWFPGSSLTENEYNCYKGAGASYSPDWSGVMPLGQCFDECKQDSKCGGITVDWQAYTSSAGERSVGCYKRGGITIAKCDKSAGTQYSTFDKLAVEKVRLSIAASMSAGNMAAVEFSGDHQWWSDAAWPGSESDKALPALYHAIESSKAFNLRSLRTKLPVDDKGHYAMIRYDAQHGGKAAVSVLNFQDVQSTVNVDLGALPQSIFGNVPIDLVAGESMPPLSSSYSVTLPAYGYVLMELGDLPAWTSEGYVNCYNGAGATYAPDDTLDDDTDLGTCMLKCLSDSRCTAVTVAWLDDGGVSCWLRGGVTISQCDTQLGSDYSTFTTNAII